MILETQRTHCRRTERGAGPFRLAGVALLAVLVACGGGGGDDGGDGGSSGGTTPAPSFKNPTVSPTSAHWGAKSVQFVVTGGANLQGNTFQAQLGDQACSSATVDAADLTKLDVVCDIPNGGTSDALDLTLMSQGVSLTGTVKIALSWAPATGPASFGASAAVTTTATWWQQMAQLRVSGGVNLPGHDFTASVGGIPCKSVAQSPQDAGALVLTCDTPPGGRTSPAASVVVQENGATVPGGTLSVDLDECADSAAPSVGERLPQLCNAQDGSTAATSAGVDGLRRSSVFSDALFMADDTGQFAATYLSTYQQGTAQLSGGSWTSADGDEWLSSVHTAPASMGGTYGPFGCVTVGASESFCEYSVANALAVPRSRVQGAWVATGTAVALTVSGTSFTGTTSGSTFGSCDVSGTIHTSSSSRNPFDMTLTATPARSGTSECQLAAGTYTGLAAIDIVNTRETGAPVYMPELVFMLRIPGKAYLVASAGPIPPLRF